MNLILLLMVLGFQTGQSWTGTASYYSRAGCVGCSENLITASGEPLDDTAYAVAFNELPLGSLVVVTNLDNNQAVLAKVNDTGGFERLGRIVDLTVMVKESIGCSDLCEVKVQEVDNFTLGSEVEK